MNRQIRDSTSVGLYMALYARRSFYRLTDSVRDSLQQGGRCRQRPVRSLLRDPHRHGVAGGRSGPHDLQRLQTAASALRPRVSLPRRRGLLLPDPGAGSHALLLPWTVCGGERLLPSGCGVERV